jgi:hypothetical protein
VAVEVEDQVEEQVEVVLVVVEDIKARTPGAAEAVALVVVEGVTRETVVMAKDLVVAVGTGLSGIRRSKSRRKLKRQLHRLSSSRIYRRRSQPSRPVWTVASQPSRPGWTMGGSDAEPTQR